MIRSNLVLTCPNRDFMYIWVDESNHFRISPYLSTSSTTTACIPSALRPASHGPYQTAIHPPSPPDLDTDPTLTYTAITLTDLKPITQWAVGQTTFTYSLTHFAPHTRYKLKTA